MSEAADIPARGLLRIMPENVTPLWPQIVPLFAPVLARISTHTAEDIRRSVIAMRSQLWCDMEGSTVRAALVTEFVDYPAGLFLSVFMAGADPAAPLAQAAWFNLLDGWRKAHGAIGFEATGRHGWLRRVPGARAEGLIMRMT